MVVVRHCARGVGRLSHAPVFGWTVTSAPAWLLQASQKPSAVAEMGTMWQGF